MRFWTWLEEAMRWRGLNAQQLAQRASIALGAFTSWRQGKTVPNLESCKALAETLGVPIPVVLFYAGHLHLSDLALVVQPETGGANLRITLGDGSETAELAVPASEMALARDPVQRAKLAIASIPDSLLTIQARHQLIALLETQVAATEMARSLRGQGG